MNVRPSIHLSPPEAPQRLAQATQGRAQASQSRSSQLSASLFLDDQLSRWNNKAKFVVCDWAGAARWKPLGKVNAHELKQPTDGKIVEYLHQGQYWLSDAPGTRFWEGITDLWKDGQTDAWTDRQTDGWTDADGWTDEWMDGQTLV